MNREDAYWNKNKRWRKKMDTEWIDQYLTNKIGHKYLKLNSDFLF